MQYQRLTKTLIFAFTISFLQKAAFAASPINCTLNKTEAPHISQLMCPIYAIVNTGLAVAGVVLSVILAYAAYRYVMAKGNPKELPLVNNIVQYAILGFIGVIGAYTVIGVIINSLGVDPAFSPTNAGFFTKFNDGINQILDIGNIYTPGSPNP